MIDSGVFKNEWAAICERFRLTGAKEPSQLMARRYYRYLSDRIDTETFQVEAARIYAECEFFPKPADFLPKHTAADAWEKVVPLLTNFGSTLGGLDAAARRTVHAMGGLSAIGASVEDLPFRRKEFVSLYETYQETTTTEDLSLTRAGSELIQNALAGRGPAELRGLSEAEPSP